MIFSWFTSKKVNFFFKTQRVFLLNRWHSEIAIWFEMSNYFIYNVFLNTEKADEYVYKWQHVLFFKYPCKAVMIIFLSWLTFFIGLLTLSSPLLAIVALATTINWPFFTMVCVLAGKSICAISRTVPSVVITLEMCTPIGFSLS